MATTDPQKNAGRGKRWLWFAALWLGGVIGLTVIAYLLKAVMSAVGMSV